MPGGFNSHERLIIGGRRWNEGSNATVAREQRAEGPEDPVRPFGLGLESDFGRQNFTASTMQRYPVERVGRSPDND